MKSCRALLYALSLTAFIAISPIFAPEQPSGTDLGGLEDIFGDLNLDFKEAKSSGMLDDVNKDELEALKIVARSIMPGATDAELNQIVEETLILDKTLQSLPKEDREAREKKLFDKTKEQLAKEDPELAKLFDELEAGLPPIEEEPKTDVIRPIPAEPVIPLADAKKLRSERERIKQLLTSLLTAIEQLRLKIGSLIRVSRDAQVEGQWHAAQNDLDDLVALMTIISNKDKLLEIVASDEFKILRTDLERLAKELIPVVDRIATADTAMLKSEADALSRPAKKQSQQAVKEAVEIINRSIVQTKLVWAIKKPIEKYAPEELKKLPSRKETAERPRFDSGIGSTGSKGGGFDGKGLFDRGRGGFGGGGEIKPGGKDTGLDTLGKDGKEKGAKQLGGAGGKEKDKEKEKEKEKEAAKLESDKLKSSKRKIAEGEAEPAIQAGIKSVEKNFEKLKKALDPKTSTAKAGLTALDELAGGAASVRTLQSAAGYIAGDVMPALQSTINDVKDLFKKLNEKVSPTATGGKLNEAAKDNIKAVANALFKFKEQYADRALIIEKLKNPTFKEHVREIDRQAKASHAKTFEDCLKLLSDFDQMDDHLSELLKEELKKELSESHGAEFTNKDQELAQRRTDLTEEAKTSGKRGVEEELNKLLASGPDRDMEQARTLLERAKQKNTSFKEATLLLRQGSYALSRASKSFDDEAGLGGWRSRLMGSGRPETPAPTAEPAEEAEIQETAE